MKIALFGITEIKLGKHNLKDPRLDHVHTLVEADKKTHAQVEVIGDDQLLDADAILTSDIAKADLILKDLEFVETRLGRDPQPAERAARSPRLAGCDGRGRKKLFTFIIALRHNALQMDQSAAGSGRRHAESPHSR